MLLERPELARDAGHEAFRYCDSCMRWLDQARPPQASTFRSQVLQFIRELKPWDAVVVGSVLLELFRHELDGIVVLLMDR